MARTTAMPSTVRTVRTVRIVLTLASCGFWLLGAAGAVLWVTGKGGNATPRLLSVDLAAASTVTICAFMCWLFAHALDRDKELLTRSLAEQHARGSGPTGPLPRLRAL